MVRTIRKKKIPEPYAQFYIFSPNQSFVVVLRRRYVLADWISNHCSTLRKHSRTNTYPCRTGQTLRIYLHTLRTSSNEQCARRYARYDPGSHKIWTWDASNELSNPKNGHSGIKIAESAIRIPHIIFLPRIRPPIASLGKLVWPVSVAEFAENPWGMFTQAFVLSTNTFHREIGEINSCELVANIHHANFKWTFRLYITKWKNS